MAFLCPSRSVRNKDKKPKVPYLGRITGSDSIDTLVRVGLEKQHGLKSDSKMVATHDFLSCSQNEVEIRKGQEVYQLYKENGWSYIIREDGKEGFVPSSFLITFNTHKRRSVLSNHENDFTIWEIEEDEDVNIEDTDFSTEFKTVPNGDKYVVLYDFQIENENDITVKRGDIVTVLNTDDNNWSWICKATNQQGFIPSSFIYLLPKHLYSAVDDNKKRDEPPPLPPRDYKPNNIHRNINIWGVYENNNQTTKLTEKLSSNLGLSNSSSSSLSLSNSSSSYLGLSNSSSSNFVRSSSSSSRLSSSNLGKQDNNGRRSINLLSCARNRIGETNHLQNNAFSHVKYGDKDKTTVKNTVTFRDESEPKVGCVEPDTSIKNTVRRNSKNNCMDQCGTSGKTKHSESNVKTNTASSLGSISGNKTPSDTGMSKSSSPVLEEQVKPSSPNFIKKVISSNYTSKTQPYLTVTKGEIVFIDYNNQTNSTWLWVYSPKCNMYGNIPVSLLKDPHDIEHQFTNIALV